MICSLEGGNGGMNDDGSIVVEVGTPGIGIIGYQVMVSDRDRETCNARARLSLFCRTIVREADSSIYGFLDSRDRAMFDRLIRVSGVGPSTALRALSVMDAEQITKCIADGMKAGLVSVPGIGLKTANKIIEELS